MPVSRSLLAAGLGCSAFRRLSARQQRRAPYASMDAAGIFPRPRGRRLDDSTLIVRRKDRLAVFALLVAVGMTLGFVGDLFMAGVIPSPNRFIGGIAGFGLGHVAYIAAGLTLGHALGRCRRPTRLIAWLAWLLVGALGWYFVVYRGQRTTALHWATLPYALLLASTAGVATGLALSSARVHPLRRRRGALPLQRPAHRRPLFAVRFSPRARHGRGQPGRPHLVDLRSRADAHRLHPSPLRSLLGSDLIDE